MSSMRLKRSFAIVSAVALVLALGPMLFAPVDAQEDDRFTCESTLVRVEDNALVGTQSLANANPSPNGEKCATDDASVIGELAVGPVTADVLYSRTSDTADSGADQGFAEAGVAKVTIDLTAFGGPPVTVELVTAEATAGPCPSTELSSDGRVAGLRIGEDRPINVDEHMEFDLGVGVLHLNEETVSADGSTITRRAVFFEDGTGIVGNIIVAEAIADVHGNPCAPERFPGWMTGGGFVADTDSKRDQNGAGTVDPGTVANHAFSLDCFESEGADPGPGKDNLQVHWTDEETGEKNHFKLTEVTDVACTDDPAIDSGPPASRFDTVTGSGIGVCRSGGLEALVFVEFTFTDQGEPGVNDTASIETSLLPPELQPVGEVLPTPCEFVSDGSLDGGNHQAHQTPAQFAQN